MTNISASFRLGAMLALGVWFAPGLDAQTVLDREETTLAASRDGSRNAAFERYVAGRQYTFGMATSCNGGCGGDSDGGVSVGSDEEPGEPDDAPEGESPGSDDGGENGGDDNGGTGL